MAITLTDYEAFSGDDYPLLLTFTDVNQAAINLTPFTLYVTIKNKYSDTDDKAVYQNTITTFTDPTHGKTMVTIPHAAAELLDDVYLIDVKYKDGNGIVGTALNGRIHFFKDVSQRASA